MELDAAAGRASYSPGQLEQARKEALVEATTSASRVSSDRELQLDSINLNLLVKSFGGDDGANRVLRGDRSKLMNQGMIEYG